MRALKANKKSENKRRHVSDKMFQKKMLKGAGIVSLVTASVGAISFGLSKILVNVALDRDGIKPSPYDRKVRDHLCGFTGETEFLQALEQSAGKLLAAGLETVEITGYDGTQLTGHFYPCENPERIIIAMHGWRSSWNKDFGMAADFWHESRCSVLFAEQRGQGASGGEYMGFGMIERYDCLHWARWADEKYEGQIPIYLDGISMGATTVLMAAGLDLPKSVHGIIADSGYTSPYAIWKHVTENHLHLLYGPIGKIADAICKKKINMASDDYSVADAMKDNKIPVLFCHGTDDPFVPVEMTYENYKACRAPKRLFVVPGAAHGMSYYVEQEQCEAELKRFWQEYDKTEAEHQLDSGTFLLEQEEIGS